ncbi:undecaprenyl-phosphate glucose phosphotransferase [Methylobacterium nodulans]|uniref:Undecaprenyl-phosphate glucose phosphotransferase n=1 Tax=Methylobacterium nodulans (strain LMG 21967 / CNCM I-2342 / ORS 2060) TaxID=460265 RepID=B8ISR2_METNO|nr:undecaprenyl-phosphate glucose phosphotransferase [Methylobacterium nodulans]ACL60711.1 Undecaprenyl-phosphate glucose phosphotransferase [Methylobacterium nodulans ORS 2060]
MVASFEPYRTNAHAAAQTFGGHSEITVPVHLLSAGVCLGEFLVIVLASWASGIAYHWTSFGRLGPVDQCVATGAVFASLFVLRRHARGHYDLDRLAARMLGVTDILSTWLMVVAILAGLAFLLKLGSDVSRGFFLIFAVSGPVTLCGARSGFQALARRAVRTHRLVERRVLLIGERGEALSLGLQRRLRNSGARIVDVIACDFSGGDIEACAAAAVGRARAERVDQILVCLNWARFGELDGLLQRLRVLPLPVLLVADHRLRNLVANPLTQIGSVPALEVQRSPLSLGEQAAKRLLDLAFASAALVALFPLLVGVALAVRLDSRGPIFFRQTRIGFSGRRFRIYKFRTMTSLDDGPVVRQATRDDARITRVGRFLRASSLDELPQLINVLRGEMSLVGPRPHALAHDDQYTRLIANYAYRHHVKPGITGLAQVSGCRGETPTVDSMERRVEFDIAYINRWTLWLDLKLIATTAVQIFKHDAY